MGLEEWEKKKGRFFKRTKEFQSLLQQEETKAIDRILSPSFPKDFLLNPSGPYIHENLRTIDSLVPVLGDC